MGSNVFKLQSLNEIVQGTLARCMILRFDPFSVLLIARLYPHCMQ